MKISAFYYRSTSILTQVSLPFICEKNAKYSLLYISTLFSWILVKSCFLIIFLDIIRYFNAPSDFIVTYSIVCQNTQQISRFLYTLDLVISDVYVTSWTVSLADNYFVFCLLTVNVQCFISSSLYYLAYEFLKLSFCFSH